VDVVFVVVESSPQIRESLCHVLLSFGVRGVPVADRAAAWETLRRKEPVEGVIVDIDNREVEGSRLIDELKADDATRSIPVIVHTVQSGKQAVMKMVEAGVAGYLLKPYDPEGARAKLASVFSKLATHNRERRHIRVKPDPDELARVSFRIAPSRQLISGRIIDISLGGMAVELFNPPAPELLAPGVRLSRFSFSLPGKELAASASVVLLKSRVLAVRFESMSTSETTALERYIFRSISS
jgi:two-component system chemotaxis response regulator CheY